MGTVINMDAQLTGTTDPARLAIMVKLLEAVPERNTPAQNVRLAAAKRLMEANNGTA